MSIKTHRFSLTGVVFQPETSPLFEHFGHVEAVSCCIKSLQHCEFVAELVEPAAGVTTLSLLCPYWKCMCLELSRNLVNPKSLNWSDFKASNVARPEF